MFDITFF